MNAAVTVDVVVDVLVVVVVVVFVLNDVNVVADIDFIVDDDVIVVITFVVVVRGVGAPAQPTAAECMYSGARSRTPIHGPRDGAQRRCQVAPALSGRTMEDCSHEKERDSDREDRER